MCAAYACEYAGGCIWESAIVWSCVWGRELQRVSRLSIAYCTSEKVVHLIHWNGWRCIVDSMFECGRHVHEYGTDQSEAKSLSFSRFFFHFGCDNDGQIQISIQRGKWLNTADYITGVGRNVVMGCQMDLSNNLSKYCVNWQEIAIQRRNWYRNNMATFNCSCKT
jgi:hypothetical protein